MSQVRSNHPRQGEIKDPDCVYIAEYLREKQWGMVHVLLEWNEKRQKLECTLFHKLPIWRYDLANMNTLAGEPDTALERSGKRVHPPKGDWIQNCRSDIELDANDTKELWAAAIDMELDKDFSYVGQFLWWYSFGPRENPYPAPKGSEVDWDWRESDS